MWLAALSRLLPRCCWNEVILPVIPATILSWHRRLFRKAGIITARRRPGRPPTPAALTKLAMGMATENPTWGHRRVQSELIRLGHRIAASTVWQILHDAGLDPAQRRSGPTWRVFLTTQAKAILAVDLCMGYGAQPSTIQAPQGGTSKGTDALTQRASSLCRKQGPRTPQTPRRAGRTGVFDGPLHGF